MKRKTKKILFLVLNIVFILVALVTIFGMVALGFELVPDFSLDVIIGGCGLLALYETIIYIKVRKKFGTSPRVDLRHFILEAMNWWLLFFYWLLWNVEDDFFSIFLGGFFMIALSVCLVDKFWHFNPCRVKFADKPSK